jgi:hypothetical protein
MQVGSSNGRVSAHVTKNHRAATRAQVSTKTTLDARPSLLVSPSPKTCASLDRRVTVRTPWAIYLLTPFSFSQLVGLKPLGLTAPLTRFTSHDHPAF